MHYRNLTQEQLDSLEAEELINKFLEDDIDEVINFYNKTQLMKKNIIGSLILLSILLTVLGSISFICLILTSLFTFLYFKNNNNLIWSVKSLKVTLAMFQNRDTKKWDHIFQKQLDRIKHIPIGELY